MLDENLRQRLRTLGDIGANELDRAARERIVETVVSRGHREMERARVVRLVTRTGLAFSAAAAVALAVGLATIRDQQSSDRTGPAVSPPNETPTTIRPCAQGGWSTKPSFVAESRGLVLDLGASAFAVGTAGSSVSVAETQPCELVIALSSGRVVVEARELGGGTLTVRADSRAVTVTKALFAVTRHNGDLVVEVAEGSAIVRGQDMIGREVRAGRRMQLGVAVQTDSLLPSTDIARIERAVR